MPMRRTLNIHNSANFTNSNKFFHTNIFKSMYFEKMKKKIELFKPDYKNTRLIYSYKERKVCHLVREKDI